MNANTSLHATSTNSLGLPCLAALRTPSCYATGLVGQSGTRQGDALLNNLHFNLDKPLQLSQSGAGLCWVGVRGGVGVAGGMTVIRIFVRTDATLTGKQQ